MRSGFPWAAVRQVSTNACNNNDSGADDDSSGSSRSDSSNESLNKSNMSCNVDDVNTCPNKYQNKQRIFTRKQQEKQEKS